MFFIFFYVFFFFLSLIKLVTSATLQQYFSAFGLVHEAKIKYDAETNKSRLVGGRGGRESQLDMNVFCMNWKIVIVCVGGGGV